MLQQITIPKTPEEVAESLNEMNEREQGIVYGFIACIKARLSAPAPSDGKPA